MFLEPTHLGLIQCFIKNTYLPMILCIKVQYLFLRFTRKKIGLFKLSIIFTRKESFNNLKRKKRSIKSLEKPRSQPDTITTVCYWQMLGQDISLIYV